MHFYTLKIPKIKSNEYLRSIFFWKSNDIILNASSCGDKHTLKQYLLNK